VKVRDKTLKVTIDVFDKKCPGRHCYWPRTYPGVS
jgi:hypothetical protein